VTNVKVMTNVTKIVTFVPVSCVENDV